MLTFYYIIVCVHVLCVSVVHISWSCRYDVPLLIILQRVFLKNKEFLHHIMVINIRKNSDIFLLPIDTLKKQ